MKTSIFGAMIRIIGVVLIGAMALGMTACGGGDDGGDSTHPDAKRWDSSFHDESSVTISHSVANDGVCTITVGGTPVTAQPLWDHLWKAQASYKYTVQEGKRYKYTFEAWTNGADRKLYIQYYGDGDDNEFLGSGWDGKAEENNLSPQFTITNQRKTYTLESELIPKSGDQNLDFQCANQTGTFYVKIISITEIPPENWSAEDRWDSSYFDQSTVTISHSVANDGVCTITVGGTPVTEQPLWNFLWSASAIYRYTAQAGKRYDYKFEAWTDGAERKLFIQWYGDGTDNVYLGTGWDGTEEENNLSPQFTIGSTRTTYTIGGETMEPIPKSGDQVLQFQCANQTGTFYVKILSITQK